ncbi:hypothetical protein PINS_up006197 [Pythium insidiosum]|nr:hypothetical protein PINS_up006197 [Pythium insidiosum]
MESDDEDGEVIQALPATPIESDGVVEIGVPVEETEPLLGDDVPVAAIGLEVAGDVEANDGDDDTSQMSLHAMSAKPNRMKSEQSGLESKADPETEWDDVDTLDPDDVDIGADLDRDVLSAVSKGKSGAPSPGKPNKAAMNSSLAKYKKKPKNAKALVKLPAISEQEPHTVPLVAPNSVNTNIQVRGRSKPKPSLLETPDSTTYLVKWKESRSVGFAAS